MYKSKRERRHVHQGKRRAGPSNLTLLAESKVSKQTFEFKGAPESMGHRKLAPGGQQRAIGILQPAVFETRALFAVDLPHAACSQRRQELSVDSRLRFLVEAPSPRRKLRVAEAPTAQGSGESAPCGAKIEGRRRNENFLAEEWLWCKARLRRQSDSTPASFDVMRHGGKLH